MDPNPQYHTVSFGDRLKAWKTRQISDPITLLGAYVRRVTRRNKMPLKEDIARSRMRMYFQSLPISSFRVLFAGDKLANQALNTPRFKPVRAQLYEPVKESTFSGYWMVQGSFAAKQAPSSSDVVICYAHGGGYSVWQPGTYTSFMLALADALIRRGLSVSVFMLDYALAPEAGFPAQVAQMSAMYAYLLRDVGVAPERIALMGDSAGAHLTLSFLAHMHTPVRAIEPDPAAGLPVTGGVFLISPWTTLGSASETFKTNDGFDVPNKASIDHLAALYLGASEAAGREDAKPYHDFLHTPHDWRGVLPEKLRKVYVSAGNQEVFVGDIRAFVNKLREGGVEVEYKEAEGAAHDWQFTEVLAGLKAYGKVPMEKEPPKMEGVEEIVAAICEAWHHEAE